MKLDAHGGDLLAMASVSKRDPASLLDFSVNVRPEGAPEFLRAALVRPRGLPFAQRRGGPCRCGTPIRPARRPLRLRQRKQRAHPRPRPRTQKARRTLRFHRRTGVQRIRAGLPPCRAGKQPALGRHRFRCGRAAFRRSAGRACRNALGFGGVSGQSLQPFGAVPHARRMPVPAGGAARPALDHRRGLHRIRRAGSRCVDPAPDALQRRSTAFADQIPCLAGGAHRLSGGLGRTG